MRRTGFVLIVLGLLIVQAAQAQTVRPTADSYWIPSDVQPVGGGESAKSTLYQLDDTIGEPNIGPSDSDTYSLGAGYRQTVSDAFISMNCDDIADLGSITLTGQADGSVDCVITTDASAGYSLVWNIATGSGGTNTGYLISELEDIIAPFTPTVAGTPQTWAVDANDARWGGRLSSISTDTDVKWGVDTSSEQWLNVGTGSYTIVSRSSATDPGGSTETLQFRAEVGSQKIQPTGIYQATVLLTASAL